MNDRNERQARYGVPEKMANIVGMLSAGYLMLICALMVSGGGAMINNIWPSFVSGLVVGLLNAILFKRRLPLLGIVISVAVIIVAWLLGSVRAFQLSINTSGGIVSAVDYSVIVVMVMSSVIGALVGGYVSIHRQQT